MHARGRRALQDCMTAIRHHCTLAEAGQRLFPNGERHLRSRAVLERFYPPALLAETLVIAARCRFDLGEINYQYPRELVAEGHTPVSWLRQLVAEGIAWRWGGKASEKALEQIRHELELIEELGYESYFLTVHDIVRFARSRHILCQGRGSAANSVVCFVLGITELDPSRFNLLFERFLSKERKEPPDIDVDFEHERREEVMQYVFRRYGRGRAASPPWPAPTTAPGRCGISPRHWACRRTRSTPWPTAAAAGVTTHRPWIACWRPASTRKARCCAACWR